MADKIRYQQLGLWLVYAWIFLLGLWWVWCYGGCYVVVTGFFDSFFNRLWLVLWLVYRLVFARIVVGLGSRWLLCGGGVVEKVVAV